MGTTRKTIIVQWNPKWLKACNRGFLKSRVNKIHSYNLKDVFLAIIKVGHLYFLLHVHINYAMYGSDWFRGTFTFYLCTELVCRPKMCVRVCVCIVRLCYRNKTNKPLYYNLQGNAKPSHPQIHIHAVIHARTCKHKSNLSWGKSPCNS